MKTSLASSRLNKELRNYMKKTNKDEIDLYLRDENDIYKWQAKIKGPPDTPFESGIFYVNITVPDNYPISPPECKFITKIFHPNVDFNSGDICLELFKDKWSPQWSLESVCIAIIDLIANPNADSPLNCDSGNLIRNNDIDGYNSMARMYTVEYATNFKGKAKKSSKLK